MLDAKEAAAQSEVRKKEIFNKNTQYLLKSCEKQIEDYVYSGLSECKVDCAYVFDEEVIQHVMDCLRKLGYKAKYLSPTHRTFPNFIQIDWHEW